MIGATSCVTGAPFQQKTPLAFRSYNGTSCCNSTDDKQLQTQFNAMNISDSRCASLVKSVICAVRRYSYSFLLFRFLLLLFIDTCTLIIVLVFFCSYCFFFGMFFNAILSILPWFFWVLLFSWAAGLLETVSSSPKVGVSSRYTLPSLDPPVESHWACCSMR